MAWGCLFVLVIIDVIPLPLVTHEFKVGWQLGEFCWMQWSSY